MRYGEAMVISNTCHAVFGCVAIAALAATPPALLISQSWVFRRTHLPNRRVAIPMEWPITMMNPIGCSWCAHSIVRAKNRACSCTRLGSYADSSSFKCTVYSVKATEPLVDLAVDALGDFLYASLAMDRAWDLLPAAPGTYITGTLWRLNCPAPSEICVDMNQRS